MLRTALPALAAAALVAGALASASATPHLHRPLAQPAAHALPDPADGPRVNHELRHLAEPGGVVHLACDGDGRSGARVQVLYVRVAGRPDRLASYRPLMGGWALDADAALREHGAPGVHFVEDAGCVLDLRRVVVPAGADRTFDASVRAVAAQGFDRPDRTYLLFVDADVLPCSAGSGAYVRVDTPCWFSLYAGAAAARELRRSTPRPGTAHDAV